MSESILVLSKGVFAFAGCCAGLRLAGMTRRHAGQRLNGLVSLMIFVAGGGLLGFGIGPSLAPHSEALARALMIVGDGFERLALILLAWFIWHTFGRGRLLRAAIALGIVAALLVDWLVVLHFQVWPDTSLPMWVDASSQVVFSLGLLWSAVEARLAYGRARRQLALGLIDPAVSHRFALWSLATACLALVCLTTAVSVLVADQPVQLAATGIARAMLYCTVAGIILLGFFPPKIYTRWLDDASPSSET